MSHQAQSYFISVFRVNDEDVEFMRQINKFDLFGKMLYKAPILRFLSRLVQNFERHIPVEYFDKALNLCYFQLPSACIGLEIVCLRNDEAQQIHKMVCQNNTTINDLRILEILFVRFVEQAKKIQEVCYIYIIYYNNLI